ncbi:MAG: hypothetical protein HY791_23435 [Deltaproteobacteria bacterium]|nr:hypothetical protein [Deltaproteobacteria bacterium]
MRAFAPLVSLVMACGSDPPEAPTTGKAELRFSVSNTARRDRNLMDALRGTIHGAVYRADQVTVTGPVDGAESVDSVLATNVDLTIKDAVTEVLHTTVEVPPAKYMFLGFFDVDGNGEVSEEPDSGDPVTLPINDFEVKAGITTPVVAAFDLIYGG